MAAAPVTGITTVADPGRARRAENYPRTGASCKLCRPVLAVGVGAEAFIREGRDATRG
jgi:hypothetical protein